MTIYNNTYDDFVKQAVLKKLNRKPDTLTGILKQTHSIFPDELVKILTRMQTEHLIRQRKDGHYTLTHKKNKPTYKNRISAANATMEEVMKALHLPHCLDYEWWFAPQTHEQLLMRLNTYTQTPNPKHMAFLGAPLFGAFCALVYPDREITILDKSSSTINVLKKYLKAKNQHLIVYNAEDPLPKEQIGRADFVFFDPPWYVEYYDLFAKRALQMTHGHISTIASILFPSLTRPQSLQERAVFLRKMTTSYHLNPIHLEADVANYVVPFFEEKALEREHLHTGNWRTGDMIIFLNDGRLLPKNKSYPLEKATWAEFVLGKVKIKVRRKETETGYVPPDILLENSANAVLSSVSRRSPVRKDIDLWTSTHIGLKIRGWQATACILEGMEHKESLHTIASRIVHTFPHDVSQEQALRDVKAFYPRLRKIIAPNTPLLQRNLSERQCL